MTDVSGKRVTVLGLGHFGGGISVSRWLVEHGASVVVSDHSSAEKLADSVAALSDLPIEYRFGPDQSEADLIEHADLIVASPAIPPHNRFLIAARAAGVPITTEICLFLERCPAPVIAVTGTKGKSTTSTLLYHMVQTRMRTWFGGNIGKSLLPDVDKIKPDDLVLLELSSFMLEHLGQMKWSPHVAVLTMLSTDHLDWHGSEQNYLQAKQNIVRFQTADDFLVLNEDDPAAQSFRTTRAKIIPVRSEPRFALKLAGEHNQLNAQTAFAAAQLVGVDWPSAQASITDFKGLPHRLQMVRDWRGVQFVNDSISTIPQAAIAALCSFANGKVIQIVGGSGKKDLPMDAMCVALGDRAQAILCIGETADQIAGMLPPEKTYLCHTLQLAVEKAAELATDGDVVLLSPGHPSYDQFKNFESRGHAFEACVKILPD